MKTLTLIIIISLLLSACGSDSKSESSEPLAVLPPEETILESDNADREPVVEEVLRETSAEAESSYDATQNSHENSSPTADDQSYTNNDTNTSDQSSAEDNVSDTSSEVPQTSPVSIQSEGSSTTHSDGGQGDADNFNTYNNTSQQETSDTYVLNLESKKIHHPECNDVPKISPENYSTTNESLSNLIDQGYTTCGHCFK